MYYNAGKQAWHSEPIRNATRTPILQSREESQCQGQGPDELGSVHFRRTLCRYVVRFEAASLNTLLMALASVPKLPIAASESRTNRRAYSVRSRPSSSFHKRIIRFFMF